MQKTSVINKQLNETKREVKRYEDAVKKLKRTFTEVMENFEKVKYLEFYTRGPLIKKMIKQIISCIAPSVPKENRQIAKNNQKEINSKVSECKPREAGDSAKDAKDKHDPGKEKRQGTDNKEQGKTEVAPVKPTGKENHKMGNDNAKQQSTAPVQKIRKPKPKTTSTNAANISRVLKAWFLN